MRLTYLAIATLAVSCAYAAQGTALSSPGPAEYRRVPCATYGRTSTVYKGIDRRTLERSVIVVVHDTSTSPEVTGVLLPSFVAVSGGVEVYVMCYGDAEFVREL